MMAKTKRKKTESLIAAFRSAIKHGDPCWRVEPDDMELLVDLWGQIETAYKVQQRAQEERAEAVALSEENRRIRQENHRLRTLFNATLAAIGVTDEGITGEYLGDTKENLRNAIIAGPHDPNIGPSK